MDRLFVALVALSALFVRRGAWIARLWSGDHSALWDADPEVGVWIAVIVASAAGALADYARSSRNDDRVHHELRDLRDVGRDHTRAIGRLQIQVEELLVDRAGALEHEGRLAKVEVRLEALGETVDAWESED